MSGIDGSRAALLGVLPRQAGTPTHPARQNDAHRAAAYAQASTDPAPTAPVTGTRGTARPPAAIGFLAQAIAQEYLLLDARTSRPDQQEPIDLYRRTQNDEPPAPGPQLGIDLTI